MIPLGRDSATITVWKSTVTETYGDVVEDWTKGDEVRATIYPVQSSRTENIEGQDDRTLYRCYIAGIPSLTVRDRLGNSTQPIYEILSIIAVNGTTTATLRSL